MQLDWVKIGMVNLSVNLCGIKLANPTMLASGVLGLSGELLKEVAQHGAGAVITKSIGIEPRRGYNPPVIDEVGPGVLLNAMGLPSPGYEEFKREIEIVKEAKVPIICNIFGFTKDEFTKVAKEMEDAGVDMLELNLSCPHRVSKRRMSLEFIGQHPKKTEEITKAVKNVVSIPVMVKLTPNVTSIDKIANAAIEGGADAISAINTIRALHIDIERKAPRLSNIVGGMSGWAIKPIAVRCVAEIASMIKKRKLDIPVIGVGGIWGGEDAVEMMMAGARCIQIGTAVMYRGSKMFKEVVREIKEFMLKNGYKDVNELCGLALEEIGKLRKWYTLR